MRKFQLKKSTTPSLPSIPTIPNTERRSSQPTMTNSRHHFLIATMVAQGHLNPCLQLAKLLLSAGATVTLASTAEDLRSIKSFPALPGLSFSSFTDSDPSRDRWKYVADDLNGRDGPEGLTQLLQSFAADGRPVTFLIYHLLLPFVAHVGRACSIPSALFCSQSATVLYIYHSVLNSKTGSYRSDEKNSPPDSVELPGLPPFSAEDIPSLLFPTDTHHVVSSIFRKHILALEEEPCPRVIINTFDALEAEAIRAVHSSTNIQLFPLGPLALSDKSYGCDLFQSSENYIDWLDSKPEISVVYVSFGSLAVLSRDQVEEIFSGLRDSGLDFLWVLRAVEGEEGVVEEMKQRVAEGGRGMVVGWCSQVEVLRHPAVGCFMTHCGWNSTTESLATGLPVLGCPLFSDQTVNAKMVEEVWGSGARVKKLERKQIRSGVGRVMSGEEGEEMRKNAMKWKKLAAEAVEEGGSSEANFRAFFESSEI